MSFSSDIKEELTKVVNKDDNYKMAELIGFMIANCTITKEGNEFILKMSTENASAIKKAYNSFKTFYGIVANTNIKKEEEWSDNLYQLKILEKQDLEKIFKESLLGIDVKMQLVMADKERILQNENVQKAFLRGVFIGSGSIVNPKSGYHLEIVLSNQDNAIFINYVMQQVGIQSKIVKRKNGYVIYLKEADTIARFLATIGSNKGILDFEETRVIKEMRNNINRLNNFENANFDKTVDASLAQLDDITVIRKNRKFESLPEHLKKLARLRVSYKEATLEELGNMLDPKLSRAGVSHRFKRLHQIAEDIRKNETLS